MSPSIRLLRSGLHLMLTLIAASASAQTTHLAHCIPAWVAAGQDAGPADPASVLSITLVLNRPAPRQAAFARLLAAQQDPASPDFHHWLTPEQIGTLYGPSPIDIAALTQWLTVHGLAVTEIAPSRVFVHATAPAATVARALSTSFRMIAPMAGTTPRLAATVAPAIPAALAPLVASIDGLSDTPIDPSFRAHATSTSTGDHLLSPADFALIYDLNPAYNAGFNGAGQRVAVIGRSRVLPADITNFEALTSLPSVLPTVVIPTTGTDPGTTNTSDQDEATLDVDRVLATAPGAPVDLVVSASNSTANGLYIAAQYQVQTLRDPIMNISFSQCEAAVGPSGVALWDTLFAQAAAEGITVTVSSGDGGAAECQATGTAPATSQTRGVNALCASSYATCVGGTEFADFASPSTYWTSTNTSTLLSARSYIPEGAYNEPSRSSGGTTIYTVAATSGGASTVIPKPTWQTGPGVPADGARDLPDVAFSASLHNGYIACVTYTGADCISHYTVFDGTSTAAPAMAGIAAILAQKIGGPQGNLNPLLYRLAATTTGPFHDATPATSGVATCDVATPSMCNNSTPIATGLSGGTTGFQLTTGYDEATGLGSLDVASFLTAAASAMTISLIPATSSLTLHPGATTGNTDLITVSSSFYTGTVALTCSVTYNGTGTAFFAPTCRLNPASVALSGTGTATSTLVIATNAPGHVRLTPPQLHGPRRDQPLLVENHPGAPGLAPETRDLRPGRQHRTPILAAALCSVLLLGFLPRLRNLRPLLALLVLVTTLNACSGSSKPASPNPLLLSFSATTLTASSTSILPGTSDTFTATVTTNGFNTVSIPTGTVNFYENGANTPISTAVLVNGQAKTTIPFPTPGTYTIAAVYQGDANFATSNSTVATIGATPNGTTLGNYTVTLHATGSGTVAATTTVALTLQ